MSADPSRLSLRSREPRPGSARSEPRRPGEARGRGRGSGKPTPRSERVRARGLARQPLARAGRKAAAGFFFLEGRGNGEGASGPDPGPAPLRGEGSPARPLQPCGPCAGCPPPPASHARNTSLEIPSFLRKTSRGEPRATRAEELRPPSHGAPAAGSQRRPPAASRPPPKSAAPAPRTPPTPPSMAPARYGGPHRQPAAGEGEPPAAVRAGAGLGLGGAVGKTEPHGHAGASVRPAPGGRPWLCRPLPGTPMRGEGGGRARDQQGGDAWAPISLHLSKKCQFSARDELPRGWLQRTQDLSLRGCWGTLPAALRTLLFPARISAREARGKGTM